jgi:hypothetical protein
VSEVKPSVIIRMGSHSEKEYISNTLKLFDGLMVGANLLQISPGATASLLFKLCGSTKLPYFVDPMTYAFGSYFDADTGKVRNDLDWIKSMQKVPGKKGAIQRQFKRSYSKLADSFGPPFSTSLERGAAVSEADFPDDVLEKACRSVISFQADRLRDVFREDPETASFADEMPVPGALFAPYFYIEPNFPEPWIRLNNRLAAATAKLSSDTPVHVVVCGHLNLLTDKKQASAIIGNLSDCKPAGVWLWFSKFEERYQGSEELRALRWWVEQLAPSMSVFNMHGGYFSLALSKYGMSGTAHGVGYGEQKDVVPVVGQSTPTVQYYVRALHAKSSVVQVQRSFSRLNIKTPTDFFEKVCDCTICKGIIASDLDNFSQFGEIARSVPTAKRPNQTPAAAKRCRYHFLLNRSKERDYVAGSSLDTIVEGMLASADLWAVTAPFGPWTQHLRTWAEALK